MVRRPRSGLAGSTATPDSESQNEFTRLEQFAKVQAPPPVKFKDLEEVVSSRILRNQIRFDYRFDFLRITGDTILVPVTVQIQNKQMTFRDHDGVQFRDAQSVRTDQLDDRARRSKPSKTSFSAISRTRCWRLR